MAIVPHAMAEDVEAVKAATLPTIDGFDPPAIAVLRIVQTKELDRGQVEDNTQIAIIPALTVTPTVAGVTMGEQ